MPKHCLLTILDKFYLLNLLKFNILRLRSTVTTLLTCIRVALRSGVRISLCALSLLRLIDILRCSLPCGIQICNSSVD